MGTSTRLHSADMQVQSGQISNKRFVLSLSIFKVFAIHIIIRELTR